MSLQEIRAPLPSINAKSKVKRIYFSALSAVELYSVLTLVDPLPLLPGNFRWAIESEFQISHSLRFLSLWCVRIGLFLTPSTFYSALLVPKYILSFYFISCSNHASPDKYLPSFLHPPFFPLAPGFEHLVAALFTALAFRIV